MKTIQQSKLTGFYRLMMLTLLLIAGWDASAQNGHQWEWRIGQTFSIDSTMVHDPVMIRQDSTWYVFATGWGIDVYSSNDMKTWKREKAVFSEAPQWAVDTIPDFKGHIWAPDIYYHNGLYYLYYSVSAFGRNTSAIGVATNKTLNPTDPSFKWVDHGRVVQSYPAKTNWNAIDPNLIFDTDGTPYLTFGSFWDGLQMVRLTDDLLQTAESSDAIFTIASRQNNPNAKENMPAVGGNPVDAGGNAIEAPFIIRQGKYFYLFASIDYCCKGVDSSYKMIVGRSKKLQGPYVDMAGKSLRWGGGTVLMQGNGKWAAMGHNAVVQDNGDTYLVYQAYDRDQKGKSILRINKITWQNNWPVVEK